MPLAPVLWRLVLCDLAGNYLSVLDGLASDVELQFRLNRPASIAFSVPGEDPRVNITHTDGKPLLCAGPRVVKAFRKVDPTVPGGWDLRCVGRVWTTEDQGDGDTCQTAVACFDNLKLLEKRIVRNRDGDFRKQVRFTRRVDGELRGRPGAEIIRLMVERTRDFAGPVAIDVGGAWEDTPEQFLACDQEYVLPAAVKLTDTGTVDLDPEYLNTFNGVHLRLGAKRRLGVDRSGTVIFAYATGENTATEYDRINTLDTMVNAVYLFAKSNKGHLATAADAAAQDDNLVMESVEILADVETTELVQYLADAQLGLRKDVRDLVTIVPTPEQATRPWDDYFVGDTVAVEVADDPFPVTREAISGVQRLYGFTVSLDNDYGEHVTDMLVSPQDLG